MRRSLKDSDGQPEFTNSKQNSEEKISASEFACHGVKRSARSRPKQIGFGARALDRFGTAVDQKED